MWASLIRDELERVESRMRKALAAAQEPLGSALLGLLESGGKRIRPALAILASSFAPAPWKQVEALAAAVELLHNATLIHDDLVDKAETRRGRPTLNSRWSTGATVLAGDYLFALAASMAAQTDHPRVIRLFAETLMVICSGEVRQSMFGRWKVPTREEYEDRIFAKTASLMATACEAGIWLGEASEEERGAMRAYGRALGLAFQVVDDVLDYLGDPNRMGKPVGSDLREGVVTLPAICYLERHPDDPLGLLGLLEEGWDPDRGRAIVEGIVSLGGVACALEAAKGYVEQAIEALRRFPETPQRRAMEELAWFVVQRTG